MGVSRKLTNRRIWGELPQGWGSSSLCDIGEVLRTTHNLRLSLTDGRQLYGPCLKVASDILTILTNMEISQRLAQSSFCRKHSV